MESQQSFLETFFKHYNAVGWRDLDRHPLEGFSSKYTFFTLWEQYVQAFVEEHLSKEDLLDVSPRERLLEITLTRLEAALPFKDSLKKLRKDLLKDPHAIALLFKKSEEASSFYLTYASLSTFGPIGCLKVQIYGGVFHWALHTWFDDDTPDQAKTMSFLDNILGYCDRVMENYA